MTLLAISFPQCYVTPFMFQFFKFYLTALPSPPPASLSEHSLSVSHLDLLPATAGGRRQEPRRQEERGRRQEKKRHGEGSRKQGGRIKEAWGGRLEERGRNQGGREWGEG
jgi:hypothetical protein